MLSYDGTVPPPNLERRALLVGAGFAYPVTVKSVARWAQGLQKRGYRPYILLEDWEEQQYRARFGDESPLAWLEMRIQRHAGLQPDAGVLGGITEWLKVAHTAASFNLPVAPHWHANVHVHLAAAVHNCITVEYFVLEQDIYNFERLVTLAHLRGRALHFRNQAAALFRIGRDEQRQHEFALHSQLGGGE